ncbi:hypothetical protein BV898_00381 [Hypsibius exemplaris]|uniref:Uncharacterized protein n=1 Tax=Hypsibius exemplaris TaxID=2072580 RepID=A0A1W0XFL6_HYPEX|nr:hypothetical protein BV898_00381 [Hypsibius exemplaris]
MQDGTTGLAPTDSEADSDSSEAFSDNRSKQAMMASSSFPLTSHGFDHFPRGMSSTGHVPADEKMNLISEFVKRPRGRPKGTTAAAGYRVSAGRPVGAHRDSQDQVAQTLSTPEPLPHAASISGAVRQRRKSVQCASKRGRPKGSTKANGYKVSPGRPKGTTRQNGYKASPGRPSTKNSTGHPEARADVGYRDTGGPSQAPYHLFEKGRARHPTAGELLHRIRSFFLLVNLPELRVIVPSPLCSIQSHFFRPRRVKVIFAVTFHLEIIEKIWRPVVQKKFRSLISH